MNSKVKALMILSVCGILTACGGKAGTTVKDSPYSLLNGRKAKLTYTALTTESVGNLNYLETSEAADAEHFCNFVDGLLTHSEFGTLEKNLAEKVEHNQNFDVFTITVRKDEHLKWLRYNGEPYTVSVGGQKVEQLIKPSDWLASAKAVCTYANQSTTEYLVTDFIKGAAEYYYYTQIQYGIQQGTKEFVTMNGKPAKQAEYINKAIRENKPDVYVACDYESNPITAEQVAKIADGSRLGVVVDDEKYTITYNLIKSAFYFPTLLTYSPYLPVNQNFLDEKLFSHFGDGNDAILYCGPYLLSEYDDNNIYYKKNTDYAQRKDIRNFMQARVDTIHYMIIDASVVTADYTRNRFEKGEIDGFAISNKDAQGWSKYITGPDGTGTYDNPYNPNVNSRLLDTIGNMYGSNISMERSGNSATSYCKGGTAATVANTKLALRLQDVRKAIMGSWPYATYSKVYGEDPYDKQYMVHTYVPKNFVYDDAGKEYVDEYYTKEYASKQGITVEQAKEKLAVGQFATRESTDAQMTALRERAVKAINLYNATATTKITFPVNVEVYDSSPIDEDSAEIMADTIKTMNLRLNGLTEVPSDGKWPIFNCIGTDKLTSSNYDAISHNGAFDFSGVLWGWGADYGDPLTYLNTYTKGGDWASIFPFIDLENVPNITMNEAGTALNEPVDLLAEYTSIVKEGAKINDNLSARFSKFAQAEYMLINELAIYMPQINYGQGWSVSVSKSAGYEIPTANYGLSKDRLTGMWVLEEPLTREERNAVKKEFDANKEKYCAEHPSYNIYD